MVAPEPRRKEEEQVAAPRIRPSEILPTRIERTRQEVRRDVSDTYSRDVQMLSVAFRGAAAAFDAAITGKQTER
jgi:hypothetical protein